MQRKTAVAAASAISMGVLSAAIAIGANFGALGFASASRATPVPPVAVTAPAPAEPVASTNPAVASALRMQERESNEHDHVAVASQEESYESDD